MQDGDLLSHMTAAIAHALDRITGAVELIRSRLPDTAGLRR